MWSIWTGGLDRTFCELLCLFPVLYSCFLNSILSPELSSCIYGAWHTLNSCYLFLWDHVMAGFTLMCVPSQISPDQLQFWLGLKLSFCPCPSICDRTFPGEFPGSTLEQAKALRHEKAAQTDNINSVISLALSAAQTCKFCRNRRSWSCFLIFAGLAHWYHGGKLQASYFSMFSLNAASSIQLLPRPTLTDPLYFLFIQTPHSGDFGFSFVFAPLLPPAVPTRILACILALYSLTLSGVNERKAAARAALLTVSRSFSWKRQGRQRDQTSRISNSGGMSCACSTLPLSFL